MKLNLNRQKASVTSRTVFIGGIPLISTYKDLHDYISKFAKVERLHLPKNQTTGVLNGYARAVLENLDEVNNIVNFSPHVIGGLEVGIMKWQNQSSYLNKKDADRERKVHVKIPSNFKEAIIYEYFSQFGPIRDISIKTYPMTNIRRNFCYITFEESRHSKLVVDMSPHTICNEIITCQMSIRPHLKNKGNSRSNIIGWKKPVGKDSHSGHDMLQIQKHTLEEAAISASYFNVNKISQKFRKNSNQTMNLGSTFAFDKRTTTFSMMNGSAEHQLHSNVYTIGFNFPYYANSQNINENKSLPFMKRRFDEVKPTSRLYDAQNIFDVACNHANHFNVTFRTRKP